MSLRTQPFRPWTAAFWKRPGGSRVPQAARPCRVQGEDPAPPTFPPAWGSPQAELPATAAPFGGLCDLQGRPLGSGSAPGFSRELGASEGPLCLGWGVGAGACRQPRLTGPEGGGQRAADSCAESVVWEQRPWSSPQRFSVTGSMREREGASEGAVLSEAGAIPGRLLPGWELAPAPFLRVHNIP